MLRSPLPTKNTVIWGTTLGLFSAVCYSIANSALKELATNANFDWAVWVTCLKAVPATLLSWIIIAHRISKGLPAMPPKELFWVLVGSGIVMQFGGNVAFQYSLSYGGLALSVPLCFSAIMLSSALLGWIWLKESIDKNTWVSISILLFAVVMLSMGTQEATSDKQYLDSSNGWTTFIAIAAAIISGVSYGISGVAIRHSLQKQVSLAGTLVWLSTVGVVALGIWCWARMGLDQLLAPTPAQWKAMTIAGTLNAAAFFCIGGAMKYISVIRANLINASQIAMCGMIGVFLFGEPMTFWLCLGTVLTMIALFTLRSPRASAEEESNSTSPSNSPQEFDIPNETQHMPSVAASEQATGSPEDFS